MTRCFVFKNSGHVPARSMKNKIFINARYTRAHRCVIVIAICFTLYNKLTDTRVSPLPCVIV